MSCSDSPRAVRLISRASSPLNSGQMLEDSLEPAGGVQQIVEEEPLQYAAPLLIGDVAHREDREGFAPDDDRSREHAEIQRRGSFRRRLQEVALLDVGAIRLLAVQNGAHGAAGPAELARAAPARLFRRVFAGQRLPGTHPEKALAASVQQDGQLVVRRGRSAGDG